MGETVGLFGSDGLFFLCGFYFGGEKGDAWEARFSPSGSPFPGTQLFEVVGMCGVTDRAMDAAVSGAKGWGDGWLCIVLTGWESV